MKMLKWGDVDKKIVNLVKSRHTITLAGFLCLLHAEPELLCFYVIKNCIVNNQVLKKKSQKYSLIMEDAKKYFDLNRFSDEEECDEDGSTTSISENSAPVENSVAKEGN